MTGFPGAPGNPSSSLPTRNSFGGQRGSDLNYSSASLASIKRNPGFSTDCPAPWRTPAPKAVSPRSATGNWRAAKACPSPCCVPQTAASGAWDARRRFVGGKEDQMAPDGMDPPFLSRRSTRGQRAPGKTKPTWSIAPRRSTTSAYFLTGVPAQPSNPLSSHPTSEEFGKRNIFQFIKLI